MRSLSNITILVATLVAASCGSPIDPDPSPGQLQVSCPLPIVREATGPQGTDVSFDAPTPTGGRAPYTVECTPGSAGTFPIGETNVRCTATDADRAQTSCGFPITVRVSQTIARTTFMAFGDSITEGAISLAPVMMLAGTETYPFKLEQMLLQRYPTQPLVVINRGIGGETTRGGAQRVASTLDADRPQVMLLLEGINNINGLATTTQVANLRTIITEAKKRGVDVLIATVLPILPTSRLYQPGNTDSKIQALNTQIFALANEYGLGSPVDLFAIFKADTSLMGSDGLHPTAQGQTRIAEAFRDEIVRRYDVRSTTSLYWTP
jgi:lysophospholipase L1-like esterase